MTTLSVLNSCAHIFTSVESREGVDVLTVYNIGHKYLLHECGPVARISLVKECVPACSI